jgi:hypothetical protein
LGYNWAANFVSQAQSKLVASPKSAVRASSLSGLETLKSAIVGMILADPEVERVWPGLGTPGTDRKRKRGKGQSPKVGSGERLSDLSGLEVIRYSS